VRVSGTNFTVISLKLRSKECESFFGSPRPRGTSDPIFRTPWVGDPRINIQRAGYKAKPYQDRQVLNTIEFSSDRAIREYAEKICKISPTPVAA
jgi:hypothetical protein